MILPDDISVKLVDFPRGRSTHEAVTPRPDGTYLILIDARLSNDGQEREFAHALQHIEAGDFEKPDVQLIEAAAHGQDLPKEEVKRLHRRANPGITRARKRAEKAADLNGMAWDDFVFACRDADMWKGY